MLSRALQQVRLSLVLCRNQDIPRTGTHTGFAKTTVSIITKVYFEGRCSGGVQQSLKIAQPSKHEKDRNTIRAVEVNSKNQCKVVCFTKIVE